MKGIRICVVLCAVLNSAVRTVSILASGLLLFSILLRWIDFHVFEHSRVGSRVYVLVVICSVATIVINDSTANWMREIGRSERDGTSDSGMVL
jgi:hypothetical protein